MGCRGAVYVQCMSLMDEAGFHDFWLCVTSLNNDFEVKRTIAI